jgi:hypothetical protein
MYWERPEEGKNKVNRGRLIRVDTSFCLFYFLRVKEGERDVDLSKNEETTNSSGIQEKSRRAQEQSSPRKCSKRSGHKKQESTRISLDGRNRNQHHLEALFFRHDSYYRKYWEREWVLSVDFTDNLCRRREECVLHLARHELRLVVN